MSFTFRLAATCAALALAGCATSLADAPLIPAKLLSCPKPVYPPSSLRNEEKGAVTLDLLIGPDGLVHETKLQRSSGYRDLDRATLASLSGCKFMPATRGGTPVESWNPIQYVWTLK